MKDVGKIQPQEREECRITDRSNQRYRLGNLTFDQINRQAISLIRPICYPAFLALLGLDFTYILYAQALVLSIIPACTFLLVSVPTENNRLGFAAGLVSVI